MRDSNTEYQIHYWALVLTKTFTDGSTLSIGIPTVLFNYEQEVAAASVDFELKDVIEISEQIEILHNIEVNTLVPNLEQFFPTNEWEYSSSRMNNLHRHPGSLSKFSSTDLSKDYLNDIGIVFPLQEATNQANFASIILHKEGITKLARTEFRIANGNVEDDLGITYFHGRCISYVKAPDAIPSEVEELFGYKPIVREYMLADDCKMDAPFVNVVKEAWDAIDYEPNTEFIKAENIKRKTYTTPTTQGGYYSHGKTVVPASNPSPVTANEIVNTLTSDLDDNMEYTMYTPFSDKTLGELTENEFAEMRHIISEKCEMKFHSASALETFSLKDLKEHYLTLERVYYGCSDSTEEELNELDSDKILEFYMLILESFNDYGISMLYTVQEAYDEAFENDAYV